MEDLKKSFKELIKKQEDLKKQYLAEGKKLFSVLTKEFFDKFGDEIKAFSWTQYTPYFNDGDSCTFGINEIYSLTNKTYERVKNDDDTDLLEESIWEWDNHTHDEDNQMVENAKIVLDEIEKFMYQNKEIMEELFGDHVRVTCTKEGVETSEYEHD